MNALRVILGALTPIELPPAARAARPSGRGRGVSPDAANLLAIALALTGLGLVMVYSTTAVTADRALSDSTFYLRKQLMWALCAGIALVLASSTDYRELIRWSRPALCGLGVLLVLCLFQEGRGGARRWLHIAGMGIQPSELGKVLLVLFLADRASRPEVREDWREVGKLLACFGGIVGLVMIEPDLGTALFLSAVGGLVLLLGGVRIRHLALFGAPLLVAGVGAMAFRFQHVKARIDVFLRPEADLDGKGYQIHQALIALGSGGTWGLGLGESRQKLYFLPDDHTDFILAIVGEELGLLGVALVVGLFVGLVIYGTRIALNAPDRRGMLVAFGLTTALGLQGAMNVAVVTASMPTKGIALPFVSYGGSALCVAMSAIGILVNIASQSPARGSPRANLAERPASPGGGGRERRDAARAQPSSHGAGRRQGPRAPVRGSPSQGAQHDA